MYKQVADDLRQQIRSGTLPPGEPLPGEGRIADEYEVGINSVRSALGVLRSEGLIVTEKGVGSRVRTRAERSVVDLPPGADVIVRPATAEERTQIPGLGPDEPVAEIKKVDGTVEVLPAFQYVLRAPAGGE